MSEMLHIVCPHCSATNRLPSDRLKQNPACGKCRKSLFSAKPINLTLSNFAKHLNSNEIPVLVDFWAPWCGPCKMMAPQFESAAKKLEPGFRLAKINTEQEQKLAGKFNIRSIPTLALFKNGKEVARKAGAMSSDDIVRWARRF